MTWPTWPKLVPVLKLSSHGSQFEAINNMKFNSKTETDLTVY